MRGRAAGTPALIIHQEAQAFARWLTDPAKGQAIIADFGKDKYGSPLFFANSQAWRERQGATR